VGRAGRTVFVVAGFAPAGIRAGRYSRRPEFAHLSRHKGQPSGLNASISQPPRPGSHPIRV